MSDRLGDAAEVVHLAGWAIAGYVDAMVLSTGKGVVRLGR